MAFKKICECGKFQVTCKRRDQLAPSLKDHQEFMLDKENHRPEMARNV